MTTQTQHDSSIRLSADGSASKHTSDSTNTQLVNFNAVTPKSMYGPVATSKIKWISKSEAVKLGLLPKETVINPPTGVGSTTEPLSASKFIRMKHLSQIQQNDIQNTTVVSSKGCEKIRILNNVILKKQALLVPVSRCVGDIFSKSKQAVCSSETTLRTENESPAPSQNRQESSVPSVCSSEGKNRLVLKIPQETFSRINNSNEPVELEIPGFGSKDKNPLVLKIPPEIFSQINNSKGPIELKIPGFGSVVFQDHGEARTVTGSTSKSETQKPVENPTLAETVAKKNLEILRDKKYCWYKRINHKMDLDGFTGWDVLGFRIIERTNASKCEKKLLTHIALLKSKLNLCVNKYQTQRNLSVNTYHNQQNLSVNTYHNQSSTVEQPIKRKRPRKVPKEPFVKLVSKSKCRKLGVSIRDEESTDTASETERAILEIEKKVKKYKRKRTPQQKKRLHAQIDQKRQGIKHPLPPQSFKKAKRSRVPKKTVKTVTTGKYNYQPASVDNVIKTEVNETTDTANESDRVTLESELLVTKKVVFLRNHNNKRKRKRKPSRKHLNAERRKAYWNKKMSKERENKHTNKRRISPCFVEVEQVASTAKKFNVTKALKNNSKCSEHLNESVIHSLKALNSVMSKGKPVLIINKQHIWDSTDFGNMFLKNNVIFCVRDNCDFIQLSRYKNFVSAVELGYVKLISYNVLCDYLSEGGGVF